MLRLAGACRVTLRPLSLRTRTVRIKAVQAIEGSDGKASVTVDVNQQTNVAAIQPGYVIRLGKFSREPAVEQEREPITIEGNVSP
jgi:hypothetical protein